MWETLDQYVQQWQEQSSWPEAILQDFYDDDDGTICHKPNQLAKQLSPIDFNLFPSPIDFNNALDKHNLQWLKKLLQMFTHFSIIVLAWDADIIQDSETFVQRTILS